LCGAPMLSFWMLLFCGLHQNFFQRPPSPVSSLYMFQVRVACPARKNERVLSVLLTQFDTRTDCLYTVMLVGALQL
jgi:hypothetical protein